MSSILKVDSITDVNGNAIISSDGSGNLTPNTFTALTVSGDLTVDTSTLYVDSANNEVGIGTTNPTDKLHVVGGNFDSLFIDNDGSQYTSIKIGNNGNENQSDIYWDNTGTSLNIRNRQSGFLGLHTGDVLRMTINTTETVINDNSTDYDFRVESNNNTHALFVDGGNDHVSIGTSGDFNGKLNIFTAGQQETALSLACDNGGSLAGPFFDIKRLSSSTQNFDELGRIRFRGHNSANGEINYAQIQSRIVDETQGTADGELSFHIKVGDVDTNLFYMTPSEIVVNEDSVDTDFRVESNNNTHMLFVDGGNDEIGIGTSDPKNTLHVQGDFRQGDSDANDMVLQDSNDNFTDNTATDLFTLTAPDPVSSFGRLYIEVVVTNAGVNQGYAMACSVREILWSRYGGNMNIIENNEIRNNSGSVNAGLINETLTTSASVTGDTLTVSATAVVGGSTGAPNHRLYYKVKCASVRTDNTLISDF